MTKFEALLGNLAKYGNADYPPPSIAHNRYHRKLNTKQKKSIAAPAFTAKPTFCSTDGSFIKFVTDKTTQLASEKLNFCC